MLIIDNRVRVPKQYITELDLKDFTHKDYRSKTDFLMYTEDDPEGYYSFPRTAMHHFAHLPSSDFRTEGRLLKEGPNYFKPRAGQEEAIEETFQFLKQPTTPDEGMLIAGCGKGKTVMACEIIRRMRMSTCVLVHMEILESQFTKELSWVYPEASIGIYRQGRHDTGFTHDIVLASCQTLLAQEEKVSEEFFNSFGFIVIDEVHRYGAVQWNTLLQKFYAKYILSVTATPRRGDGYWPVVRANLGDIIYRLDSEPEPFKVYVIDYDSLGDDMLNLKSWEEDNYKIVRSKTLQLIARNGHRNGKLAGLIVRAYKSGRKVMFISERLDQLDALIDYLKAGLIPDEDMGLLTGKQKGVKEKEAISKQVIFTTFKKAAEALDIPELDTIILGTPKVDVEQLVGRAGRKCDTKKETIIVDIIDTNLSFATKAKARRFAYYKKLGGTIIKKKGE